MLAGCLVGTFYSIHFVQRGLLWECIVMHLTNNFLCSLLPRYSSASELINFNVFFQSKLSSSVIQKIVSIQPNTAIRNPYCNSFLIHHSFGNYLVYLLLIDVWRAKVSLAREKRIVKFLVNKGFY